MTIPCLTAKRVLAELKQCKITHIVCLPESGAQLIYNDAVAQSGMVLVPVCREGEAIAVAAGLTLGGKRPVVWQQNTGFFESGDSLRGIGLGFQLPLLLLIGYRGWKHDPPLTDSAAIFTEPILNAWGIKHHLVETDEDTGKISIGYEETRQTCKPVAILIGREHLQP
jgi:sulfopyruvate decarboxylase TPP-binding subunit